MNAVISPAAAGNQDDPTYDQLLARFQARWAERTAGGKEPVFVVPGHHGDWDGMRGRDAIDAARAALSAKGEA